jgi:hypothetical protein
MDFKEYCDLVDYLSIKIFNVVDGHDAGAAVHALANAIGNSIDNTDLVLMSKDTKEKKDHRQMYIGFVVKTISDLFDKKDAKEKDNKPNIQ